MPPTLGRVCQHQLRAKGLQHDATLKRHAGGHGQDELVALHGKSRTDRSWSIAH